MEEPMSQSSDLGEEELRELEGSARPESTRRATAYGVNKFEQWLVKRERQCDFHSISAPDLNELLRKCYAEVKAVKQGTSLTPSTLTGLRAAMHRYVTSAPFNRPFNIIKDREFTSANKMFAARCKLFFKQGNPKPKHKPAIGAGDMTKLGQYFSGWKDSPQQLVEACWFFMCFYFGRRGREGWTSMKKNTFCVDTDTEGHESVSMNTTEVTKNHQGGHKQTDIDYSDQRMYGLGVQIFELYLSKLRPGSDRLFQTPLRAYLSDGTWFSREPMGKNTLSSMIQRISNKAGLSCVYTCHSVRASTITTLFRAGVQTQSIIAITKHKNTSSLTHYIDDLSSGQKRDCSNVLSDALKLPSSRNDGQKDDQAHVESGNFDLVMTGSQNTVQSPEQPAEDQNPWVNFMEEPDEISQVQGENLAQPPNTDQPPPVMDITMGPGNTITLPQAPQGTIYNVPVVPAAVNSLAISDTTTNTYSTNGSPTAYSHNLLQNILSSATFNNCTVNIQLKK